MKKVVWIDFDPEKLDLSYMVDRFQKEGYDVITEVIDFENEEEVIRHGLMADAVVSQWEKWNARTLEAVKGKLKFIMKFGMGTNNIDIPYATKVGIPVANIAGANAASVAEVAFLHILNCGRGFTYCADGGKKGVWPHMHLGNELDGKTVGLYGLGNIARQLVRMLAGFQVKILAYDPYISPATVPEGVELLSSLEELFQKSDFVSLHVPYTKETDKSIDVHLFALMKPTAYLVNTCRGGVVNEDDLAEALRSGIIRGAGLDVLTEEPPTKDNPLLSMENVTITTHVGANTAESDYRAMVVIADTIIEYLQGGQPKNVLNKDVFC